MNVHEQTGRAATLALSAIAALGIAGALGAIPASAATTITATTSVTNHPDTTSVSGGVCRTGLTPNGPAWAVDNYSSQLTATQTGTDTWQVAILDSGDYVAFADPTTCAQLLSTGTLTGDYTLTVTSATAPTAAGLHATYDGDVTTTQMVEDFFGDAITDSAVVGGDYDFSYQGGNYVQNTSGATGDVTPVACTVTVTKPASQTSVLNTAIAGLQISATSNYPASGLEVSVKNLPSGLTAAGGTITGTPVKTGTSAVTVTVTNGAFSTPTAPCAGTTTFNWTVSLTAPSSSSSSSGSGSNAVPTGGVETGGGKSSATGGYLVVGMSVTAAIVGTGFMLWFVAGLRRERRSQA